MFDDDLVGGMGDVLKGVSIERVRKGCITRVCYLC